MTLHEILNHYQEIRTSTREQGDLFERFIKKYLMADPQYADRFTEVWLWSEFPYRGVVHGTPNRRECDKKRAQSKTSVKSPIPTDATQEHSHGNTRERYQ